MALLPFAAVLMAGVMTGMTGFGFSVLAVPLLVLAYGPHDVVIIVLCLVPITSAVLVLSPHLSGRVDLGLCARLTGWSVLGLPVGAFMFSRYESSLLSAIMGVVILAYAVASLASRQWRVPRILMVPSGVLGGLLATSTGLSGPAVAMYVHGRRMHHDRLVATMAGYVGAISLLGLAWLAVQGQVTSTTLAYVAPLAPIAAGGVLVGRWWARRKHSTIERIALQALALMGAWTVVRALVGS